MERERGAGNAEHVLNIFCFVLVTDLHEFTDVDQVLPLNHPCSHPAVHSIKGCEASLLLTREDGEAV